MKKRFFVLLTVLLLAVTVLAEEYTPPKLDGDPLQVIKKLYLDLLSFKGKADFHRLGFGKGSPISFSFQLFSLLAVLPFFLACFPIGGSTSRTSAPTVSM